MKSFLQNNDIEMYSTHNEGISVITERFIIILKNQIDKYMTPASKNLYINKLNDIVEKSNITYLNAIKTKPVNVKSSTYINPSKESKMLNLLNLKLVI